MTHSLPLPSHKLPSSFICSLNTRPLREYLWRFPIYKQAPVCILKRKGLWAFDSLLLLAVLQRRISTLLRTPYAQTSVYSPISQAWCFVKPISFLRPRIFSHHTSCCFSAEHLVKNVFRQKSRGRAPWSNYDSSSFDNQ